MSEHNNSRGSGFLWLLGLLVVTWLPIGLIYLGELPKLNRRDEEFALDHKSWREAALAWLQEVKMKDEAAAAAAAAFWQSPQGLQAAFEVAKRRDIEEAAAAAKAAFWRSPQGLQATFEANAAANAAYRATETDALLEVIQKDAGGPSGNKRR